MGDTEEQLVEAFRQYDRNKTGTIASDKLVTLLKALKVDDETIRVGLSSGGGCGDGSVKYEDFVAWVMGGSENSTPKASPVVKVRGSGVSSVYVAKLRTEVPHVDRPPDTEQVKPKYETLEEFRTKFSQDPVVQQRLLNKVKVCKCGKANAVTLTHCNSCGASLASVPVSHNNNVFMGFIYGIAHGNFPYTISIRDQGQDYLCFDDPLNMSICHLNAIPTSAYIADLRYLFLDPAKGLKLVNKLFEVAATAALGRFWGDAETRKRYFNNESPPTSPEGLFEVAACGMNFPPSMYQLHLQFIHPPFMPFHYAQVKEENHFHHGRFFPLEYLRAFLALGDAAKVKGVEDMDIKDLIAKGKALGINYDEMHIRLLRQARRLQERFSPWKADDFAYQVIDGQVISTDTGRTVPGADAKSLHKEDTQLLSNYGRPYGEGGKKHLSYYKYAKSPGELASWP